MLFVTHVLFGVLAGLLLMDAVPQPWIFFFVVVFFSCMPDIDHAKSKVGNALGIISRVIQFVFAHRGFIHSVWLWLIAFFVLRQTGFFSLGSGILVGYLSHAMMDGLTRRGIQPFCPLLELRVRGFVLTGGRLENVVTFAIAVGIFALIWLQLQSF